VETPVPTLRCGTHALRLDQPRIMGVINVTPDSFSDGGQFADADAAIAHGVRLVAEGADLLDVGGESTRPGASAVDAEQEIARVVPVIAALAARVGVPIAIDTSKPEVMRAAVAAGASLINDVRALREPGALDAVAALTVPVCLMHMQGEPQSMQDQPHYDDVVADVHRFLAQRILDCQFAGVDKARLLVDPGFGFGKTLEHNLSLLRELSRFGDLGVPVLVGLSRKSMIGALTGRAAGERVVGSVTAALLAVQRGAAIVRVHDVAATRDALSVWNAVRAGERTPVRRDQPRSAAAALFDED
jgi:dihydropteroate synthase